MAWRTHEIGMTILGLVIAGGNLVFWFRVIKLEDRFRRYIERRYNVAIGRMGRGHWQVTAGCDSAVKRFAIGMWQLGYFMGAYLAWAIAMCLGVGALWLLDRATT